MHNSMTITNHGFQTLIEEGIKAFTGLQLGRSDEHYYILMNSTQLQGDIVLRMPANIDISVSNRGVVEITVDVTALSDVTFNALALTDKDGVVLAGTTYLEAQTIKADASNRFSMFLGGMPILKEERPYKIEINFPHNHVLPV